VARLPTTHTSFLARTHSSWIELDPESSIDTSEFDNSSSISRQTDCTAHSDSNVTVASFASGVARTASVASST
jgi:hypothetical protein